jgi:hypothetical protein
MRFLKLIFQFVGWTVLTLLAVAVIVRYVDGDRRASMSPRVAHYAPAQAEAPIDVTADAMAMAYERNSVAADEMFKGHTVRVSGKVTAINTDLLNRPVLELDGQVNQFLQPQAILQDSERSQAARINVGETVRLLCTGAGDVAKAPMMNDCSFR